MNRREEYLEVTVHAEVDSAEVVARFAAEPPLGAWEGGGTVHLYWHESSWNPGILHELEGILATLGISVSAGMISVASIPDQDWNLTWSRSLAPLRIGRQVGVRQSWNTFDDPPPAVELIIDPRRAFGTGYHATTQLIIEWLEDLIAGGEKVLDLGTGSGILAMAAIRLGAASTLGIDNDPVAIECAREYAAMNGFGSELQLRVAEIEQAGPDRYDLVLANIDTKTLTPLIPWLLRLLKPSGRLLLSGVLQEDYRTVVALLSGTGAGCVARRDRDEWTAIQVLCD